MRTPQGFNLYFDSDMHVLGPDTFGNADLIVWFGNDGKTTAMAYIHPIQKHIDITTHFMTSPQYQVALEAYHDYLAKQDSRHEVSIARWKRGYARD